VLGFGLSRQELKELETRATSSGHWHVACLEMVNSEIPKHYTASPSSYNATPHLTINREVALDLDSNNAFEGLWRGTLSPSVD